MASLLELHKQHAFSLNRAEALVRGAEQAHRELTDAEEQEYSASMTAVHALQPQIKRAESQNTIFKAMSGGMLINSAPGGAARTVKQVINLSDEYLDDFHQYLLSGGKKIGAALYEGSDAAGGFAVPIVVDSQIVPLAPQEMAIRRIATVLPTVSDIKFPIKAAHGTAASKAESGGSDNAFATTSPVLEQTTLAAFMSGSIEVASFEALQDIGVLQSFIADDLIIAVQEHEEPKFISGSGSGEPQGVVTGSEIGTYATAMSLDAMDELVGSLKAIYLPGASLLMARATSVVIRKLCRAATLFEPRWTRVANQDYYDGYPAYFSDAMPSAVGDENRPVLFGDFKRGFVIGDRGGSGIFVKILDQTKAHLGQIEFLGYRRSDSRIRRSEAIKALKIDSAS